MSGADQVLTECKMMFDRGATIEDVLRVLRDGGFSQIHSIKALVDLGQANLADAKRIVHYSSTWADARERNEELWRDLTQDES
jgi:hypothetical protein